jgi:hypothetical protein
MSLRDSVRSLVFALFISAVICGLHAEESCLAIHGRLHYYGGDGQLRIWQIGTHHELTRDESTWDTTIGWLRAGVNPS